MKFLTVLLIALLISGNAWSQVGHCEKELSPVNVGIWSEVQREANDAQLALCHYHALSSELNYKWATESVLNLNESILSQKLFDPVVSDIVEEWMASVVDPQYRLNIYPSIFYSVDRDSFLNGILYLNGKQQEYPKLRFTISAKQLAECQCETALRDLKQLITDVNYTYTKEHTVNIKFVIEHNRKWQTFLEDGRAQTYWDIAATTIINNTFHKRLEGNDFNLPPERQYFFMRPNIVIENVGAAIDGQEVKESIALEVFGINWWQKDACRYFSCGFSLTVNYADRSNLESTGWGVMFHINNSYSLGISKYGGSTGVFVTVDLLKLFSDKQATYTNYKKRLSNR